MDLTGMRVYLSGPMTGHAAMNVDAFAVAHERLRAAGADYVYDPALYHLTMPTRKGAAMGHDAYVMDSLHELTSRRKRTQGWVDLLPPAYDLVVQLPGWEQSDGAIAECQAARACGIPCATLAEALA